MARQDFINQLSDLGYQVEDLGNNKLAFTYLILVGPRANQEIKLGFEGLDDFPVNPPAGPHISPRMLPINPQAGLHPSCGIHESPFGSDWEYWSRPYTEWGRTDHTVRTYMAHIRHLFETL